jgi:hypothetical protein
MPTNVFRALLADTISTMTTKELRNIIMNTPDQDLETVGAAVLAEKGKKGTVTLANDTPVAEATVSTSKNKQANPRKVQAIKPKKKTVVAKETKTKVSKNNAQPSKRKCESHLIEASRLS